VLALLHALLFIGSDVLPFARKAGVVLGTEKSFIGAPRKRHSASSCKCCRESANPAHFVSSLGQIAVM